MKMNSKQVIKYIFRRYEISSCVHIGTCIYQYERRMIFHIVEIETMHELKCQSKLIFIFCLPIFYSAREVFIIHDLFNQTPILSSI